MSLWNTSGNWRKKSGNKRSKWKQRPASSIQPRFAACNPRSAVCVSRFAPHILYPIKKHRLSLYEQSLCFFLFLFLPGRSGIILVPFIVFGRNGCEIRDLPPAVSRGSRMAGRGPQVADGRQLSAVSSQPRFAVCGLRYTVPIVIDTPLFEKPPFFDRGSTGNPIFWTVQ